MKGYKGFDKDLKCRDYQFEIGKTYEHEGEVKARESGFHFCENPLDVFVYYPPADSRYAEVEGDNNLDRDNNDSKVACSRLTIGAEIKLNGLISAGAKFILDKINWQDNKQSNTGNRSAATNTGDQSAATNTGYQSAATNTGYQSAATNTGNWSAATNTGDWSAASVEGKESIAIAIGRQSKAKGPLDCWLILAEWTQNDKGNWHRTDVQCKKIDGVEIKADTWYRLENGIFIEAEIK